MINKLSTRHSTETVEDYYKYTIKCPTCGTVLNFSRDDVQYEGRYDWYLKCPECNEQIAFDDFN